jgi:hypothetical protein
MDRIAQRVKSARHVGYSKTGETGYRTAAVSNIGTLCGANIDNEKLPDLEAVLQWLRRSVDRESGTDLTQRVRARQFITV